MGFAGAIYGFILLIFYLFQEKFLFFPDQRVSGDCPAMQRFGAIPMNVDGLRYYEKSRPDARAWVVIFHGNAGNACDRIYFMDLLNPVNVNVVILEYPGYGRDKGRPSEQVICESALCLINRIRANDPESKPVFLMGESLGTGVAAYVAARNSPAGLILLSAYTSIEALARHHYPWLPVRTLLRHKFRADLWASEIRAPVILFHGIKDDIIPIRFAREQVKNFHSRAELLEIPGCGHNDLIDKARSQIQNRTDLFITQHSPVP